jgi:hypothetical protein
MSTKSHTYKKCGTLKKILFSTLMYAKIHKERLFFVDNKIDI